MQENNIYLKSLIRLHKCSFIMPFSFQAPPHCGETITTNAGYITPPDVDADGYYDFNLYCFWHIQMNTNACIVYQFLYIAIEVQTTGCVTDHLTVSAFHHDITPI